MQTPTADPMAKKKLKKPVVHVKPIETVEGLTVAVNRYVELSTDLARRKAKAERAIAAINSAFEAENAERMAEVDALAAAAHIYCDAHQDILDRGRSREMANAIVGFRTNPPKVEKIASKDTFEAIARRMQAQPWAGPFIKLAEPEINKELLLSERANLKEADLAAVGLRIAQGETFFISPKGDMAEPARIDS